MNIYLQVFKWMLIYKCEKLLVFECQMSFVLKTKIFAPNKFTQLMQAINIRWVFFHHIYFKSLSEIDGNGSQGLMDTYAHIHGRQTWPLTRSFYDGCSDFIRWPAFLTQDFH